jgi:hypothetical protein
LCPGNESFRGNRQPGQALPLNMRIYQKGPIVLQVKRPYQFFKVGKDVTGHKDRFINIIGLTDMLFPKPQMGNRNTA